MIEWSDTTRPRNCRNIASRAVLQLVKSKKISEEQTQKVLKFYLATMEKEDALLLPTTLEGLPLLGKAAEQALPQVEKLAEKLPAGSVKNEAKKAAETIRGAAKNPTK